MRLVRPCLWLLSLTIGCADVLGLDAYGSAATGGAAGSTNSGGTAGSTGSGGTAGSTGTGGMAGSTSSGGTGGSTGGTTASGGTGGSTGGTGGSTGGTTASGGTGGSTGCTQGMTQACYTGPAGTEGIGDCHSGVSTCTAAGEWGACAGDVLPKIEDCASPIADESCDQIATCTGQFRWAKVFGDKVAQAPEVVTDANDDLVIAAGVETSVDFGGGVLTSAGSTDVVVAKLGPDGQHLWSKIFGKSGAESPGGVALDASGNIVITGTFEGTFDFGATTLTSKGKTDIFVAKLDPGGAVLWAVSYGGTANDTGTAVAVDSAGPIFVTGGYQKEFTVGADALAAVPDGLDNVFLAKLDGNTGSPIWTRGFGGAGAQTGRAVAVGVSSGLYFSMDAVGAVAIGCGGVPAGDGVSVDIVLAKVTKLNASCNWVHRYGDAAPQTAVRLAPMSDNGVVAAGLVQGTVDFGLGNTTGDAAVDAALWRVDGQGATLWARRTVTAGAQYVLGLASDSKDNVIAAGTFNGNFDLSGGQGGQLVSAAGYDRFVTKLDGGGGHVWSHRYPNGGGAIVRVAADKLGRIDLVSSLLGATDLGGGDLGTAGDPNFKLLVGQFAP